MKILIYDKNIDDLTYLSKLVQNLPIDISIHTASTFQEGAAFYYANKYDTVFVDFIEDEGKKLLAEILKNDHTQRIITLSKLFECSEALGCDYCLEHYNKKRVIKPISEDEILQIFTHKEDICSKYSGDILIMELKRIEKIIKQSYTHFTLDIETLTFIDHGESHYKNDFFLIIDKLTEYKVKHTVDENGNIKVLI